MKGKLCYEALYYNTTYRPFFEFYAISSKIELNHYDPNGAVFAKKELLRISIGFEMGKESGISFC